MEKKVLSEQSIYYGDISMPKGFEIEEKNLTSDILESKLFQSKFKFSVSVQSAPSKGLFFAALYGNKLMPVL